MPIFGRFDAEDEQEKTLETIECDSEEEEEEKSAILRCVSKIREINKLLRFIGGRIGQFLQG